MKSKYLYIETIGCQMNVYDSERIIQGLKPLGYETTTSLLRADVILLNTCAIREKAEQKAFSFLGRLADLKKKNPSLIIGIGGCVAQQEGEKIIRRAPHVDLVFGTQTVHRLPEMIQRIIHRRCRVIDVEMSEGIDGDDAAMAAPSNGGPARFVTIMRGCDNFCAYCVVPYVRGRETSRKPENIVSEIQALVSSGVREVTLLGQNVNSYGKKEGLCSFSELLERVNAVEGLLRIRFTTSHPKDISEDLIRGYGRFNKLCHHIHLPVQSGSDNVLKRMNRRYTREQYLDKIEALQGVCPDIAVTSDFIVGFPGETRDDFQETLELIEQVRFDGVFAFKYSDRPKAPAAAFPEKVEEMEKTERLQQLFDRQSEVSIQKNQMLVGSTLTVLVEGESKKQDEVVSPASERKAQWTGRTSSNKIVNFMLDENPVFSGDGIVGSLVDVYIEKAFPHSLWGGLVDRRQCRPARMKGADSYAA
jgi:tRNA-2-methylthio-N6-dimethylallyladenosine synthase